MKRVFRVLVNLIAALMLCVFALSLVACEDIKKLEISIEADEKTYTLSVDLYRHLAPNTVDGILGYVNEGYYNGKVFYKYADANNKQIMVGDLYFGENGAVSMDKKAEIKADFTNNGVKGSDLVNNKGYIGLWRSWYDYADGNTYKVSDDARESGSTVWYMPTEEISAYNGNFCVFAKFDTEAEANKSAFNALTNIFANAEKYTKYVIYYTGEYNAEKKDEDFGLNFNCISQDAFDDLSEEDKDAIFETEDNKNQLVKYNKTTVQIPTSAKIVSIKVV